MSKKVLFLALGSKHKVLAIDDEARRGFKKVSFDDEADKRLVHDFVEVEEGGYGCFLQQDSYWLPKDSEEVVIVDKNEQAEVEKLLYQGLVKRTYITTFVDIASEASYVIRNRIVEKNMSLDKATQFFLEGKFDELIISVKDVIELNGKDFVAAEEVVEKRLRGTRCPVVGKARGFRSGSVLEIGEYDFFYDEDEKEWIDLKNTKQ